jgi:hypothetical protein
MPQKNAAQLVTPSQKGRRGPEIDEKDQGQEQMANHDEGTVFRS